MCFPMGKDFVKKWKGFWRSSADYQKLQELQELQERQAQRRRPSRHQRQPPPPLPFLFIHHDQAEPLVYRLQPDQQYHNITVHDIKLWCKETLYIPLCTMTVQYKGGYLKDDHATLESLGILPNTSHIYVFGERVTPEQLFEIASGDLEEVGACQIIKKVVGEQEPLTNRVTELEQQQQTEEEMAEVRHLSQVLTRTLISLDGVECPSRFATARQERRQAIRIYQDLLDRVTGLKSRDGQQ